MADQPVPMPGTARSCIPHAAERLLEWLHGWVVTVDHKKLGILYVVVCRCSSWLSAVLRRC